MLKRYMLSAAIMLAASIAATNAFAWSKTITVHNDTYGLGITSLEFQYRGAEGSSDYVFKVNVPNETDGHFSWYLDPPCLYTLTVGFSDGSFSTAPTQFNRCTQSWIGVKAKNAIHSWLITYK